MPAAFLFMIQIFGKLEQIRFASWRFPVKELLVTDLARAQLRKIESLVDSSCWQKYRRKSQVSTHLSLILMSPGLSWVVHIAPACSLSGPHYSSSCFWATLTSLPALVHSIVNFLKSFLLLPLVITGNHFPLNPYDKSATWQNWAAFKKPRRIVDGFKCGYSGLRGLVPTSCLDNPYYARIQQVLKCGWFSLKLYSELNMSVLGQILRFNLIIYIGLVHIQLHNKAAL